MTVLAANPSAMSLAVNANFTPDAMTGQIDVVTLKETGYGSRRKAVFRFRECVLPVVDNAGVGGQVSNVLAQFPTGLVMFEGAVLGLTVSRFSGSVAGLADAWTGIVALGSTTGIAATLTTTEQDYIQSTVVAAATLGVATPQAVSKAFVAATPEGAPNLLDNSAGTKTAFLNLLIDQASRDGTAVKVKLNGFVAIHYTFLGNKAAPF